MLALRKKRKHYHADLLGRERVRGSLGTRNEGAAKKLIFRLEAALSAGLDSPLWADLKIILPAETYERFAGFVGVKEKIKPTWEQMQSAFDLFLEQQVAFGKLSISTVQRYRHVVKELNEFLTTQNVKLVEDITAPVIEAFKVWRLDRIRKKKFSRGTTGLVLDVAITHRLFSFAVKRKLASENPVCMEGPKPGENPLRGAEPFTEDELESLRKNLAPICWHSCCCVGQACEAQTRYRLHGKRSSLTRRKLKNSHRRDAN
jgi:hypothetical protein